MTSIASFVISLLAIFFLTISSSAPAQAHGFENGTEDGFDCVGGKTDGCKCCGPDCKCPKNCQCGGDKTACAKAGNCANGNAKCGSGDKKMGVKNANVGGKSEVFFQKTAYKSAKKGKAKGHCALGAACCKGK